MEPIYTYAPAASKNDAQFESGQNRLKNNHLDSEIQVRDTLCDSVANINEKKWNRHSLPKC